MEGEPQALSDVVQSLPNDELLLGLDVTLLELEQARAWSSPLAVEPA